MISLPAVAPDLVKNVLNVSVKAFWNCGVNVAATNPARGPMGLDALTTSKFIIYGNGQIRK